jgi:hypothetical protein
MFLGQIKEAGDAIIESGREFGIIATLFVMGLMFAGWLLWNALKVWKDNESVKTEAYVNATIATAAEMKESYRAHTASALRTNEAVERMAESSINTNHAVERISQSIERQMVQTSNGHEMIARTHTKTDAIHRAIGGLIDVAIEMASGDPSLLKQLNHVQEELSR